MIESYRTPSGDETIRLFTALPVPKQARDMLAELPRHNLKARWTEAEDLHITLRFLGDTAPSLLPPITQALDQIRRPGFGVEVAGLNYFINARQAVLYTPVRSIRKVMALTADISDALAPLGFDFGTRPYTPHITLARLPAPVPIRALKNYVARYGARIQASWQAEKFSLIRSELLHSGPPAYKYIKFYLLS